MTVRRHGDNRRPRWNHNIHYHSRILDAIPHGAQRALDIGCGVGVLTRELRQRIPAVTGIDLDEPSLELARQSPDDVTYLRGDFQTHPLEPASYDVVASVATLHHVDAAMGLARMRELLRPGGVLAIVGLARADLPVDLPYVVTGVAAGFLFRIRHGRQWQHPSPMVWPPPTTYGGTRALAAEILPGAQFRLHLLLRYSLIWRKPANP